MSILKKVMWILIAVIYGVTLFYTGYFFPHNIISQQDSVPLITATDTIKEVLSNGTNSWDGVEYETYPSGTPQLTVLKITIPPNKSLDVHTHPMPNVAYVEEGSLTVKKQANGEIHTINKGDVLREMVNEPHYGYTNEKGVVLICFYAGTPGLPLSIPVKE